MTHPERSGRPKDERASRGRGQQRQRADRNPSRRDSRGDGGSRRDARDSFGEDGGRERWYPAIPDDVELTELSKSVQHSLDSLPESLAMKVGGHLVMAARLLQDDPDRALEHAQAGHDLAPRVGTVREALAIAAYNTGAYQVALREARTVRRMTGDNTWLPLMGDCERGLGRPERALDLLSPDVIATLDPATQAEALIVISGARADLGQAEAAVAVLDTDLLRNPKKQTWVARLRFAYAEALFRIGEDAEGMKWLKLAAATDPDGTSGAAERLDEFEGIEFMEIEESAELEEDEVRASGQPETPQP